MRTQTSQAEEYDVLVPGSGEAGKYIAWTLAKKEMGTGQVIQGWDEGVATMRERVPQSSTSYGKTNPGNGKQAEFRDRPFSL